MMNEMEREKKTRYFVLRNTQKYPSNYIVSINYRGMYTRKQKTKISFSFVQYSIHSRIHVTITFRFRGVIKKEKKNSHK